MAHFFIDRPIFAWVIAILIMLAGVLAISTLPVAQYPSIAPPEITVTSFYPGASAKTLEDSVTQVIEQKMKGIDNLNYMYSYSDSTGQSVVTLSFKSGTDSDIAQVQVQNKLQLAMPLLPQSVQKQGVIVAKSARNFLLVVAFYSADDSMSEADIGDYIASSIQDPISRVEGVGEITLFGAQYAMRVWVDPLMLEKYKLTITDLGAAIQAQNAQIAGGQIGGAPSVAGQLINYTVIAQTRLQDVQQFENILLKVTQDGSAVYLKDVARVELGGENFSSKARFNGKVASGLAVKLSSDANALDTADKVKAELDRLATFFPPGLKKAFPYDTTPFVRISIHEVYKTLFEAILLVFLVMYLFLQNFRATLIPTIAVPVVLLGTFGVLAAFGFSINTLTMFAMVLAIGLLVDDAIVVVENVERVMREEGLNPRDAAKKSMSQITGALVGIAMVLSAVFVPMAFFGGSVGVIYRQFSITIVASMTLSVVVALVLTPALCATMLKAHKPGHEHNQGGFFGWFNRWFDACTNRYQGRVGHILAKPLRYVLIYVLCVGFMGYFFLKLPTAFLPEEDQGILFAQAMLEPGATYERTIAVVDTMEKYFLNDEKDAVDSLMYVAGFSFSGNGQNNAMCFVQMKPWDDRKGANLRVPAVVDRAMRAFSQIKDARAFAFAPPAVVELGTSSGFDFELLDRANLGHDALMGARNMLLGKAMRDPRLVGVRPNGLEDTPQYKLDFDLTKAAAQGLNINDVNNAVAVLWGSSYVDDFLDRGRTKKVFMQAAAPFRMQPEDFNKIHLRNAEGKMVPFSTFSSGNWMLGSPRLERYQGLPAIEILGQAAPGLSSGQAMDIMEEYARDLPPGFDYAWTNLSYQERQSGSQAPLLYAISLLVVFLCLAALYESWSIPFSVMLIVPLGVIGSLAGAMARGLSNDVYFQVGLLTIIGLSAKNAILIVEFAKDLEEEGMDLIRATLEAVRMRLRPILMTSFAFILGVMPLVLSTGAGSGSQNAIGTGVMAGMLSATFLGIFFIPLSFVLVSRIFKPQLQHGPRRSDAPPPPKTDEGPKQRPSGSSFIGEGI